ncbi:PREDICTED: uncharacterized protein LOC107340126 [Acropora digitifera]|uniref:uncharacterized protein LOC107340126 n=1 Tax=Acropora digitifera TaxID=70779 RepID=UPI00077AE855|nr:PREDICTED: uncharacterized protein LOC107340126 [Acropora digitifera]
MSSEVQQQIQQDWENREFIEIVSQGIKKIAEFLNDFDMSCRSRIAKINEQLTSLEQKVEYIEGRVSRDCLYLLITFPKWLPVGVNMQTLSNGWAIFSPSPQHNTNPNTPHLLSSTWLKRERVALDSEITNLHLTAAVFHAKKHFTSAI